MNIRNLGLEAADGLDGVVTSVGRAADAVLPRGPLKDMLHGVWLGHPLHPLLTDLPIGFWTSAWILDLIPSKRFHPAADALVALGVASAVPTAAAGLADWSQLNRPEQRSGVVHAAANLTATALYAASLVARRRGRRGLGVGLAMAGATAATAGGFLGGHLTFRRGAGVNRTSDVSTPDTWTKAEGELPVDDVLVHADLDGTDLVVARAAGRPVALADRSSHLGGPLHQGERSGDCVRCPWHGSTFRLDDGTVVHGLRRRPNRRTTSAAPTVPSRCERSRCGDRRA